MGDNSASYDDVQRILDSDLENFENEVGELYDEMLRYSRTAGVMDADERYSDEDAEYFRELAVDTYKSFMQVLQLKKQEEDYEPEP